MATQTKSSKTKSPGYVDAYEDTVERILGFQERAARATGIGWIQELAGAQSDVVRTITSAYARTARGLLP